MSYDNAEPKTLKTLNSSGQVLDDSGEVISDTTDYWKKLYDESEPKADKILHSDGTIKDSAGNIIQDTTPFNVKKYNQAEPIPAKYLHEDGTIDENSGSGGDSYDDTELRNRITQVEDNIGDLVDLATQASQTATAASQTATEANEKIGDLADLETTAKNNLVAAINEVKADTTPDVLVANTLVGDGIVRLRKVGKIVYMNIADVRNLEESQDYLLYTLPEKFRPSEAVRTIISLSGGSWAIQGFTGLNISPNGNVQLYTYVASSSEAAANATVTWIQA